jgi:hypothetical protein
MKWWQWPLNIIAFLGMAILVLLLIPFEILRALWEAH